LVLVFYLMIRLVSKFCLFLCLNGWSSADLGIGYVTFFCGFDWIRMVGFDWISVCLCNSVFLWFQFCFSVYGVLFFMLF
jgi:hypothetical protein